MPTRSKQSKRHANTLPPMDSLQVTQVAASSQRPAELLQVFGLEATVRQPAAGDRSPARLPTGGGHSPATHHTHRARLAGEEGQEHIWHLDRQTDRRGGPPHPTCTLHLCRMVHVGRGRDRGTEEDRPQKTKGGGGRETSKDTGMRETDRQEEIQTDRTRKAKKSPGGALRRLRPRVRIAGAPRSPLLPSQSSRLQLLGSESWGSRSPGQGKGLRGLPR